MGVIREEMRDDFELSKSWSCSNIKYLQDLMCQKSWSMVEDPIFVMLNLPRSFNTMLYATR